MTEYRTVKGYGQAELIERRSRFIATVNKAQNREEAETFIAEIKKQYKDATHNVWAYVIDSGNLRCSDDGEPSGTAGLPVLETLKKNEIEKTVTVVTRYFGGVLLGAGGLVRAYSAAANLVIHAAGIALIRPCLQYAVSLDYKEWGRVKNALEESPAVVENISYSSRVEFSFYIETPLAIELINVLNDLTGGTIEINQTGENSLEVPIERSEV